MINVEAAVAILVFRMRDARGSDRFAIKKIIEQLVCGHFAPKWAH